MRIDEYVIIGLASEAKYGCNDICINLTKSDIKAVSGYNSVRLTLADTVQNVPKVGSFSESWFIFQKLV
mgnify:CR=1 FL=1